MFSREDCGLAYRDSRFKAAEPDRYLITSIRLRLDRHYKPQLEYAGLREELSRLNIRHPTAIEVSDAVIRLRQHKLPDPATFGNTGSFFKNPVLDLDDGQALLARYPELPAWPLEDGATKVSAAWMIEHCGLKGHRAGDAGISDRHALVIVNYGSATGEESLQLARNVQSAVQRIFGIALEPEPRIVDF